MTTDFKKQAIGLFGFCPELTQGTPNWDLTAAAGGSTTALKVAAAALAALYNCTDDFLNGLYVYFKANTTTVALRSKVYKITDTAWAADVLTLTMPTMADTPVAGDTFVVMAPLKASEVKVEPKTENLSRDFERQTLDGPSSLKGIQSVSGSFKVEVEGLAQENGSGDTPAYDSLSHLFKAIGTRRSVAGTTVATENASTTDIKVTSAAAMEVGDLLMIGGEVCRVTSIDLAATPDLIVVAPPLSVIYPETTEVFQSERFTPADQGHQAHTFLFLRDDQLIEARGCVCNFSFSAKFAELLSCNVEFDGENWDMQDTYSLDGQQGDKYTIPFTVGRAYFGTTALYLNSFEMNLGHERSMLKDTNLTSRYFITARKATNKVVFRDQNLTPKETWEAAGTLAQLLVQVGNAAKGAVAIMGQAQIQDAIAQTDVEKHVYWDAGFQYVDDQTDYSLALKPMFARF